MLQGMVGHYRIVAPAGKGGMGVVYRAIDTRLNRPVAIKAIQEGAEPKAMLRLRAEALAAASLDHPYICKVYELVETDAGTNIVMEYVEGETLAMILRRGPLSVPDLIRYGREIAEAVAEAHSKGLVHRDIKPSNIIVTPHGHVKVLDFGLARIHRAEADEETLTGPGVLVGTPFYMSPEQATGDAIDRRSDVFSLGVVLFECLTSKRPFEGDTRYTYLRNVLSEKPRALRDLLPDVPPDLDQVISQCLEKDPAKRPDSAALVAAELARLGGTGTGTGMQSVLTRPAPARRVGRRATAATIVLAIAATALWFSRGLWVSRPVVGEPFDLKPIVTWREREENSRISPDGQWISFISERSGKKNIWLRNLRGTDPIVLTTQPGVIRSHVWSPDGQEIAYRAERDGKSFLQIVPAFFGGAPRLSIELPRTKSAGGLLAWIDSSIFIQGSESGQGQLNRIDLPNGAMSPVSQSWVPGGRLRDFAVSRDGQQVVFSASQNGQVDLWLTDLKGSFRQLTNDRFDERYPVWVGRDASEIVFQSNRGGQLDLWRFSVADRSIRQISFGPAEEVPEDASVDGSVLTFKQTEENANLWKTDPQTRASQPVTADGLSDLWPSVSERSSVVAHQRASASPGTRFRYLDAQVLVGKWTSTGLQAPFFTITDGFGTSLSADGSALAYLREAAGRPGNLLLFVADLASQQVVQVSDWFWNVIMPFPIQWRYRNLVWAHERPALYFVRHPSGQSSELRRFTALPTGRGSELLFTSPRGVRLQNLSLSQDDERLAYVTAAGETSQAYERDLRTGATKLVFSEDGASGLHLVTLGWSQGDKTMILGRSPRIPGEGESEVLELDRMGKRRLVGGLSNGFLETGLLVSASQTLYLTKAEGPIHNLHAFSLTDGSLHRMTDNAFPLVTYVGLAPLPGGSLLYSRYELKEDVWMIRFPK